MTKFFLAVAAGFALTAGAWAQQAEPKQPKPKSQKEVDALVAIQSAATPDARIKACEDLITKFADTEFKEFALQMETLSYQQKNDYENMVIAGERTLEANPDNAVVLVTLAEAIPRRTREHDLDKDEKLSKAEKYAKRAQTVIPNLTKFNPQITDEQWTGYKKNAMSQVHEALGLIALDRKNYAASEQSFKSAIEVAPQPDPMTFYDLAAAYIAQNKYDDAIAALDKSIAAGGVKTADGRDLAADQKARVMKAKGAAAAKPAAAPAAPAAGGAAVPVAPASPAPPK